ncbi:gephyrin [Epargyreus clarus]|uniref:gephyrin n=1 Tax=Epargyreus clarus TaxID=520877 RepID=UPI003C2BB827
MVKAVAIITISDTCFKDNSMDSSGNFLLDFAKKKFPEANIHTVIIPDEKVIIERELIYFCGSNMDLILTTGGTGLSSRDVTPEATKAVIHKEVPAISVALTLESLKKTPMAMLSRAVAGIRDKTLIINFPGSLKAVTECVAVVKPVLSHAISILKDEISEVKEVHASMQENQVNPQRHVHNAVQNEVVVQQPLTNSTHDHVCPHLQMNSSVDVSAVALRPRESPYPMLEMADAFKIIDTIMEQWVGSVETINIEDGLGRVVAQPLHAKEPMPPFPASVKDGYACISSDGAGVRKVRTAVTAGDNPQAPLVPGECARVNTGAALPVGADCVVQVEDTKLVSASPDNKIELEVEILVAPQPQQDLRPVGFDIPLGSCLVEKGDVLDAAQIGILAGAGFQQVTVRVNPKIGLLSTGNELQEPYEETLRPAHIRDSNRTMLKMLLREHGYDSIDCGLARDEPAVLMAAIAAALRRCDVLVCTGGVSMGEKDLLKPVLINDFGATLHFGRLRMKPGKPSTFATCEFEGKTKYIFALPGNPVSAYVCCLVLVVRALRRCARRAAAFARVGVRLARDVTLDPRPEYARAILRFASSGDLPTAILLGNQCSSRLLSACGASVLLELPGASPAQRALAAGTSVSALLTGRIDSINN